MHPLVQNYIKKQDENTEKAKNALLISLGLFEKVYSDEDTPSREYPESELVANKVKYYKKVAVQISDEEYAEILKYQKQASTKMSNKISNIFKVLAWFIFLGGFIAGLILGSDIYGDFSFLSTFLYWCAFFVAGMGYYGFGEIIQLLADIKNK